MPHFTLQVTSVGPVIDAVVAVSTARLDALTLAGTVVPKPVRIRALIDTGASCTCIEPSVLQALQLSPIGQVPVLTPSTGSTPQQCDQYDVALFIPSAATQIPFGNTTLLVLAAQTDSLHSQGIQGLIGRDILADCLLHYNGTAGFFTLAY